MGWRNRADRRGIAPEMGGAFNVAMPKDIASEDPWQAGRHRGSQASHRSKSAAKGRRGPKPHAAGQLGLGGGSLQDLTSASCQRSAKSSPHVRLPAPCKVRQSPPMLLRRALGRAHHRGKKGCPSEHLSLARNCSPSPRHTCVRIVCMYACVCIGDRMRRSRGLHASCCPRSYPDVQCGRRS